MSETADVPMDKLARVYRKMQARIQELTATYESEVEALKAQQETIKNELKDRMLALGVKSVNTDEGTVILSTKTRYNTQDWDSFKKFILEHEVVDLLEKRIAQTNMARYLEENPGSLPPGLNSVTEFEIRVTKPTK